MTTNDSAPSQNVSAANAMATHRLACPDHGLLASVACTECDKQPYDLDNPDDLSVLKSLRAVARSERVSKMRILTYVGTFASVLIFPSFNNAMLYAFAAAFAEASARALAEIWGKFLPAPMRRLERVLR